MQVVVVDTENRKKDGVMWQIGYVSVHLSCEKDLFGGIELKHTPRLEWKVTNFQGIRRDDLFHVIQMMSQADVCVFHNAKFDVIKLKRQCKIYGVIFPVLKKTVCTMTSGRVFKKSRKLISLTDLYTVLFNKIFFGAHDALNDAKATFSCFIELVKRKVIVI